MRGVLGPVRIKSKKVVSVVDHAMVEIAAGSACLRTTGSHRFVLMRHDRNGKSFHVPALATSLREGDDEVLCCEDGDSDAGLPRGVPRVRFSHFSRQPVFLNVRSWLPEFSLSGPRTF